MMLSMQRLASLHNAIFIVIHGNWYFSLIYLTSLVGWSVYAYWYYIHEMVSREMQPQSAKTTCRRNTAATPSEVWWGSVPSLVTLWPYSQQESLMALMFMRKKIQCVRYPHYYKICIEKSFAPDWLWWSLWCVPSRSFNGLCFSVQLAA